jgi:hypothetical protein
MGGAMLFDSEKITSVLKRIVAQVTDPVKPEELLTAKWRKITALDLAIEGPGGLNDLFTTKDRDVLTTYVHRTYYATVGEADAILGGMLAVSED